MASNKNPTFLSRVSGGHVDALARRVIAALRERPPEELRVRLDAATLWLAETALSPAPFDSYEVMDALLARNISAADIIDHCIGDAMRLFGDRWNNNESSFVEVSLASARLHSLCKNLSSEWEDMGNAQRRASILVVVVEGENHLMGAVSLTDQLRRCGCSVHLMTNSGAPEVAYRLNTQQFDAIIISASCLDTLDTICDLVHHLRTQVEDMPRIALGGPLVPYVDNLKERTDVDLVTTDLAQVLPLTEAKDRKRNMMVAQ